jgi:RNA polymerase sigma-70 factor (ECF subfamily)
MTIREFEIRFRKLYLPLGMYALRIIGDADDAEDAVQNAFVKAWQIVESGADVSNFDAYLYRSVRNECISFLRQQKETVGVELIHELCDDDIDTSERDARIWRAIDDLPEKCREVFLMSKQDGLSNEEIAEELNISIKTVKNQMTKAFSRLRDALDPKRKPFFLPFL